MKGIEHIPAKKSLGQHFLNNSRVPALMADAAQVMAGDTVVEIGPGTGVLTRELLKRGSHVLALEVDERAILSLQNSCVDEITSGQLTILKHDAALGIDTLTNLPSHFKVVSNIPYYLSGRLFRVFLESKKQPSCLVFLVQKEVAERIARDKKESLLSLSVKVYGVPKYIKTIARGNFTPQPKVDSAIVAIQQISRSHFTNIDEAWFFTLLHAGFSAKRKQLLGNLTKLLPKDVLLHIFSELDLSPTIRAEDVKLETWLLLAKKLDTFSRSDDSIHT